MTAKERAHERELLRRDLLAQGAVSVAFRTLAQPVRETYVQQTLGMSFDLPRDRHESTEICNHVGTGRESQARFFGSGFDTICAACGQVTEG